MQMKNMWRKRKNKTAWRDQFCIGALRIHRPSQFKWKGKKNRIKIMSTVRCEDTSIYCYRCTLLLFRFNVRIRIPIRNSSIRIFVTVSIHNRRNSMNSKLIHSRYIAHMILLTIINNWILFLIAAHEKPINFIQKTNSIFFFLLHSIHFQLECLMRARAHINSKICSTFT